MNLRHLLTIACSLSLGLSATAWADLPDAGSTGGADDATATADAGAEDVAAGTDATGGSDTSTGPDLSKIDACWKSKCPNELAACQADPNCIAFVLCNYDNQCIQAIPNFQSASYDLGTAFQKCGGKACTDPSAGSCKGKCGQFISADKCHCDDPCIDYGDCCSDKATICGDGSCAKSDCAEASTGSYLDGSDAQCGCGADCETNQDCCADYGDTCQGKTPACTPKCDGKVCGPDGCGGACGTCKAGEKCLSGACQANAGADAGSNLDSATGGAEDAVGGADTGSTTGGSSDGSTSKSSGCTAGSTGNGAGWASALIALGLVLVARRRLA